MTDAISGAVHTRFVWVLCGSIFRFRIVICRIVPFLLIIVLSVLKFTDSDYPVGIFIIIIRYCMQSIYTFCICILDKPVLFQNKTLVQLKTEILKPVWVSLTVKSFEKPVVFWMKSCGGKLSTWFVREIDDNGTRLSNTYLLSSNIIPLEHKHFGSYSVRIRNSEGNTDVALYLMYEGSYIYSDI
jgi:hypothetical protein